MFEKLTGLFRKDAKKVQTNRRIAAKLHDTPFKYISEKDLQTGEETIVARGGHLNLIGEKKNELCATVGTKTVFRLAVDEMDIWELMSLDGCILSFFDLDTQQERRMSVFYEAHLS